MAAQKKLISAVPKEPARDKKVMLRLTAEEYDKLVRTCVENQREIAWSIREVLKKANYI